LYIFSAVFSYIQQYIMARISQSLVYDLREEVDDKLNRLPLEYYDKRTQGEILSRVTNDIDLISSTMQDSLMQATTAVLTLVGVLVMMLMISPLMTVIALVTIPMSLLSALMIAKQSQKQFSAQQKALGELNGHIEEMYGAHEVVKAFSREKVSLETFDVTNIRYFKFARKAQFISGIVRPAMGFIGNIGYVAVCIVGGILATGYTIQVGDIQAFIQYMRQFNHPIMQIASITNVIQSTIAAAERAFEVLDEPEMSDESAKVTTFPEVKGHVEFNHVRFSYVEGKPVIHDLSVDIAPGSMVAIVGPTGAGKTTLVNLLMRFYEVDGGAIRIDGIDTRDVTRAELRRNFGMVLQDTWLFSGTIKDNIAFAVEQASDETVVDAARAAHADHFIRTLPAGYETRINEEASNISAGQKQLLTIARAILADPAVLILDEATSSIDTRTERLVQRAMRELLKDRTSFVIAHRLSTIRDADCILVLRAGDIVEQGTHDELLAMNGFYAELYNSQFVSCIDGEDVA
ncbi:MAG: ABC transporter ATP-binding protein, partial [Actinobacteria bacterium]|nr:ABC transporter ATP-binding protein [Actinomycetota bacterium]